MDTTTSRNWRTNVVLSESDGESIAQAVLENEDGTVRGVGNATRIPEDPKIEEIGDELAAGRALIDLGRRLVGFGEADVETLTGQPAHVRE